jgi:hypothetical protein
MFGIYTQIGSSSKTLDDLSPKERLAYDQTMEAFDLLASNFNKGTQQKWDALGIMTNSLEKGNENIAYLGEFSNSTNKIFKND